MQDSKTYRPQTGIGKTGQNVKEFGEAQNALNAALMQENAILKGRMTALEIELTKMHEQIDLLTKRIEQLEEAQTENVRRFSRAAESVKQVGKEVDRLRLTTKLNTNAIDRLSKKDT